jgi:hypothetical protein
MTAHEKDIAAIEAIILRQFESLSWTAGAQADWEAFAADFSEHAALWPAARPAAPQTVPAFVARMRGIAQTSLTTFHEELLGSKIQIFGNVAVAVAAAEMTENATDTNRNVEMLFAGQKRRRVADRMPSLGPGGCAKANTGGMGDQIKRNRSISAHDPEEKRRTLANAGS